MLVSGLWHGASYNFILWGGIHGLAIITNHIYLKYKINLLNSLLSFILMQFFLIFSWIPFRTETISQTLVFWKKMFFFNFNLFTTFNYINLVLLFVASVIVYIAPNSFVIFRMLRLTKKIKNYFLILSAIIIFMTCFNSVDVKQFIYFDF